MRDFMVSVRVPGLSWELCWNSFPASFSRSCSCFCEEKDTFRLVFWSHKLTYCGLIIERFVFKEVCSGRGYVLPLDVRHGRWS